VGACQALFLAPTSRCTRPDIGHADLLECPADAVRIVGAFFRRRSDCTARPAALREIIRLIEDDGWRLVAQRGSHRQYAHPTKPGKVTVAGKPNADVPTGTATNILRQAGLGRSSG